MKKVLWIKLCVRYKTRRSQWRLLCLFWKIDLIHIGEAPLQNQQNQLIFKPGLDLSKNKMTGYLFHSVSLSGISSWHRRGLKFFHWMMMLLERDTGFGIYSHWGPLRAGVVIIGGVCFSCDCLINFEQILICIVDNAAVVL